jgi:hypothetical protein
MEVAILYNKSNQFGLKQDCEMIREALKQLNGGYRVREADPLEPPVKVEIAIHLEVPVYTWMPWASVNILLCNNEWYETESWNPYLKRFDGVFFRSQKDQERFISQSDDLASLKTWVLPWACQEIKIKNPQSVDFEDGFVWFLGGSKNKREAAQTILPEWKPEYPSVKVYTTTPLDISGSLAPNVHLEVRDLDKDERMRLAAYYPAHICFSKAESFGYAAAEAEANGAVILANNLDVFEQDYGGHKHVALVTVPNEVKGIASYADLTQIKWRSMEDVFDYQNHLSLEEWSTIRREQKEAAAKRRERFFSAFGNMWNDVKAIFEQKKKTQKVSKHLPPVLMPEDCPPISIVTLLYNRRKFFDLACHNIMLSDYPKEKIEWVIVEDSDDPDENASDRVIQVGLKSAPLQVVYVPLDKKTPISEKRNLGCKRAKNDIILFMDDDDHYPETSIRRRVAWLTKHPWSPKCVGCTTIACYDLLRGVSAVNTPPWNIPLGQRISEATLCFYKKWWEDRHFTFKQDIAEGEDFVKGREHEFLEVPPQQMIVAFSHKKNVSGRRIPADDAKPGCFWGFPKEYLIYIHKLAGVEVEEDKSR